MTLLLTFTPSDIYTPLIRYLIPKRKTVYRSNGHQLKFNVFIVLLTSTLFLSRILPGKIPKPAFLFQPEMKACYLDEIKELDSAVHSDRTDIGKESK